MATARPVQSLITIQRTQDQLLGRRALSGWQDRNLKLAVLCHTLEGPASRMNNTIKQYPTLLHIKHSHLWKVHKLVKRAYLRILNASLVALCFRRAAPTQTACFLESCLYQALGPLQEAPRSKNCSSWSVFLPALQTLQTDTLHMSAATRPEPSYHALSSGLPVHGCRSPGVLKLFIACGTMPERGQPKGWCP